ncbi:DUF2924 domain-containing protein [Microbaculum sp. FT89]|uniref:DUF2924 domain-containing protein n=1 Tax=Microbaculum sp. FT89 TaxID=3447298 RepID=UPI003F53AA93
MDERLSESPAGPMVSGPGGTQVEAELRSLGALSLRNLRARWKSLYGHTAPPYLRRDLLIQAIAYQMQVEKYGGLSAATKRKIRTIAEAARGKGDVSSAVDRPLRPGTRLVREWRGETHTVAVVDGGFEWRCNRYRSLSAVARAITGTSWNGRVFFGLKASSTPARRSRPPRTMCSGSETAEPERQEASDA